MDDIVRDPQIMEELRELVRFKHGRGSEATFVEQESTRLYDLFSEQLISFFEPMISEEKKAEFDNLSSQPGVNQETLMGFLIETIPDLQNQVLQALHEFEANYIRTQ